MKGRAPTIMPGKEELTRIVAGKPREMSDLGGSVLEKRYHFI